MRIWVACVEAAFRRELCSPALARLKAGAANSSSLQAISGNEISGCAVGIGLLVSFVHWNSRRPEADEKALTGKRVGAGRIHIKQVHKARAGCSRSSKIFRHLSDKRARERIVQVDEQRSSWPWKFCGISLHDSNLGFRPRDAALSSYVLLRDASQLLIQLHSDDFPERQFRRKQQRPALPCSHVDEAVGFDPA